ncbi:hypothetical protein DYB32_009656, partial [Aphanomyces invadans]
RIKAAVTFDMSVQDADSRIGRMLDGLAAAVRRDRQEWVIREESQAIVKIITDAIKPASLHRAVTEQMSLSRNKPLKKDVYRFPMPQGCLKCKSSDHKVRNCPGISDEEAVRLLKEHAKLLAKSREPGAPGGRVKTIRKAAAKPGRSVLMATVNGVLPVEASLLDSGADMSVVSGGLVSALLAAGNSPEITTMGRFELFPYGAESKPIVVTKQVRLGSIEFKTACGPLILRGLRVWLDDAATGVELTLGLPVMQRLGYNEQTLLENAYNQQAVWDLSDQPEISLHHSSRLKLFSVESLDVDEDLRAQIAFGDDGFYVEALQDLRMYDGTWQVLVKWLGLDELESSWEPALSIYEDIPVIFRRWAESKRDEDGVCEMIEDIEGACGHPL